MEVLRIGSFSADSTSVARLCRVRLVDGRGRMPFRHPHVKKCDVRHMEVPRIGGFSADSTSVARLCRVRLVDGRGRMPDPSTIR